MNLSRYQRPLAGLVAVVVAVGLALDFGDMVARGEGFFFSTWRFVGYFTQLTNMAVVVVSARIALSGEKFHAPRTILATLNSILMVGIVYSVALRPWHHPVGIDILTNHIVHDFSPPAFLLVWLLRPHGHLKWDHVRYALIPPLLYTVYALTRGFSDGWFPYWFLNPVKEGVTKFATGQAILVVSFTVMALILIVVDKWLGRTAAKP